MDISRVSGDDVFELQLSSKDAVELSPSGYRSHLRWNLAKPMTLREGSARLLVALAGGFIPRSITQVNERNDEFTVTVDDVDYICTLSEGNYNALQLRAEIESQLQEATLLSFQVSYSVIRNKITITLPEASASSCSITFAENSAGTLLGFTAGTHALVVVGGYWSATSDIVVNCSSTPSLEIRIENLSFSDSLTVFGSSNILRRIYFSRGWNSIEVLDTPFVDWKLCTVSSGEVSSLEISLRDSSARLVNLNGVDWELSLYLARV